MSVMVNMPVNLFRTPPNAEYYLCTVIFVSETDVGTYTYFDIVLYFPNAW